MRIGLDYVASIGEEDAKKLVEERERGGAFSGVVDLAQRSQLDRDRLGALVASGACDCFGEPRRTLLWQLGLVPRPQSVPGAASPTASSACPSASKRLTISSPIFQMLSSIRPAHHSISSGAVFAPL